MIRVFILGFFFYVMRKQNKMCLLFFCYDCFLSLRKEFLNQLRVNKNFEYHTVDRRRSLIVHVTHLKTEISKY